MIGEFEDIFVEDFKKPLSAQLKVEETSAVLKAITTLTNQSHDNIAIQSEIRDMLKNLTVRVDNMEKQIALLNDSLKNRPSPTVPITRPQSQSVNQDAKVSAVAAMKAAREEAERKAVAEENERARQHQERLNKEKREREEEEKRQLEEQKRREEEAEKKKAELALKTRSLMSTLVGSNRASSDLFGEGNQKNGGSLFD